MAPNSADRIELETKGMVLELYKDGVKVWLVETDLEKRFHTYPNGNFVFSIDLSAIRIGHILKINLQRQQITALEEIGALHIQPSADNCASRQRIEVPLYFVPLDYPLYPAGAKQKNLVKAYTDKLEYVPILKENTYRKHTIYSGNVVYYLKKKRKEKKVAKTYSTGWQVCNNGILADTNEIQQKFDFLEGLIVDSSMADAFYVYGEESGLVSLRKNICVEQQIGIGDWIKFILLVVDEAEKSDESKEIFPNQEDDMEFFRDRKIAIHPIKMPNPYYETKSISKSQIQIMHKLNVPMNPTKDRSYQLPYLGKFTDPKGLIDSEHQGASVQIAINSRIVNYETVEFELARIFLLDIRRRFMQMQPHITAVEPKNTKTFLESIDVGRKKSQQQQQTREPLAMLANGNNNNNSSGVGRNQQQQHHHQPQQNQPSMPEMNRGIREGGAEGRNKSTRMQMATPPPTQRRSLPSDTIMVQGIVVELVQNNNNSGRLLNAICSDDYVLAFSNDMSLNSKIIRIGSDAVEQMPQLGHWLNIFMKKIFPNNPRNHDRIVSRAEKCKAPFETSVGDYSNVRVRVKLTVSNKEGDLYNKVLGKVNNSKRLINIPEPEELEKPYVMAWCSKMKANECRFMDAHWEIANTPDPIWVEDDSPKKLRTQLEVPDRLLPKIGFLNSKKNAERSRPNVDNCEKKGLLCIRKPYSIRLELVKTYRMVIRIYRPTPPIPYLSPPKPITPPQSMPAYWQMPFWKEEFEN